MANFKKKIQMGKEKKVLIGLTLFMNIITNSTISMVMKMMKIRSLSNSKQTKLTQYLIIQHSPKMQILLHAEKRKRNFLGSLMLLPTSRTL
jgi:hypothetical protein